MFRELEVSLEQLHATIGKGNLAYVVDDIVPRNTARW